jgi:hypothetical protein
MPFSDCADLPGHSVPKTVTLNVQEALFPAGSTAEHCTSVVPSWKIEPEFSEHCWLATCMYQIFIVMQIAKA